MTEASGSTSDSKHRIIHVAFALFVEHGFAGVSMQHIADGAGITKATLYHHFRDKQDIFIATVRMAFGVGLANIERDLQSHESFRDKLMALVDSLLGPYGADLQRLGGEFKLHIDDATRKAVWDQFAAPFELLTPVVQDAMERGEVTPGDPAFASRFIYASIVGMANQRRIEHLLHPPEQPLREQLVDMMLAGLSPRL